MKPNPTTLLIIAMFGSFVLILGAMVVIFRPATKPTRQRPTAQPVAKRDTLLQPIKTSQDTQTVASKPQPSETKSTPGGSFKSNALITSPKVTQDVASLKLYRELKQEQKEMVQLRADMELRLKQALADHKRKLTQLARRCEPLEPGEAAQILMTLSDEDIASVLKQMKPDKTAPIIELLKRNGRNIK
jgi:flagellar motility protein MotE (MotC chaperone)